MKYSFIIAAKNSEKFLERSIVSVLSQSYPNYEIIVQDGESTDGTHQILNKYASRINYCSEPDTGVYDAWNKALERVSGDWVLFLGSDDFLVQDDVLIKCHRHIKKLEKDILFAYGCMVFGTNGHELDLINRSLDTIYRNFNSNMAIPMPATFLRASLLKKFKFDTSYKIAGDFEFVARFLHSYNVARLPVLISYMERGGLSTNPKTKCMMEDERGKVLYKHILPKAQELVMGCMQHYWDNDTAIE